MHRIVWGDVNHAEPDLRPVPRRNACPAWAGRGDLFQRRSQEFERHHKKHFEYSQLQSCKKHAQPLSEQEVIPMEKNIKNIDLTDIEVLETADGTALPEMGASSGSIGTSSSSSSTCSAC